MKLTLGKRADYSIRAVLYLAQMCDRRCKARDIADAMDVPESYLPQILANLVRHGVVTSTSGPDGGYHLLKDPGEVTLLEVIEAAEGEVRSSECVLRGGPCRWEGHCAVHEPWSRAQDALVDELGSATFGEIVALDALLD